MKYRISIAVSLGANPTATDEVVLSDKKLFTQLRSRYPNNSINPNWFVLQTDFQDALSTGIFDVFKREVKKSPSTDHHLTLKHLDRYYSVQVERIPEVQDLDDSPWLYLTAPKLSMAKFKAVEPDDSYVIQKVTSKKKIAFGCTDYVGWMMLFSEELKNKFLCSELRGIGFKEVKLENSEASGLWQITSQVRMPPLAMKLTDGQGGLFIGDETKACVVDEGSYVPMVLKYLQKGMTELPDVDVIMSAERIGFGHNAHRMHIVSQRFRQVADKLAPGQFSYGLVAVGEGEELQTRYTIPELAPPRDAL